MLTQQEPDCANATTLTPICCLRVCGNVELLLPFLHFGLCGEAGGVLDGEPSLPAKWTDVGINGLDALYAWSAKTNI